MTPELASIRRSRSGRFFILVAASRRQARYFTTVAKFISAAVVASAQASFRASMTKVRELEEFIRGGGMARMFHLLRKVDDHPMVSRDRATRLAQQFHGKPRAVRGEL